MLWRLGPQGGETLIDRVDCAVIGAGVIGLAAARALALAGRSVLILEAEGAIGTGISSRNSEVIHAGLYYPPDSLKAALCGTGNRLLRAYAQARGVPFRMTGKLIVATDADDEAKLAAIDARARANGVVDLEWLSGARVRALEPDLAVRAALLSPSTGIIDVHALMLALLGEAEAKGAQLALRSTVTGGEPVDGGTLLTIDGGGEPFRLIARQVVLAAGLAAPALAARLGFHDVPTGRLCKGNYFTLTGKAPFARLVYPVPVAGGLGVHYTLDLGGCGRFGPDVEWVEAEDYRVDPARKEAFARAIHRYWPACPADRLEPAYAGIRPKICGPGTRTGIF